MRIKKILLPKWVPWFVLVVSIFSILLVYYGLGEQKNITSKTFLITLIMFAFIIFVLFFISYRQVPYLILLEVRK